MKYVIIWILISIISAWILLIHKWLIKYNWYIWLFESIRYPYVKYKINKKLKYLLVNQKIKFYTDLIISDWWNSNWWFCRKLEKHILLKHLSELDNG